MNRRRLTGLCLIAALLLIPAPSCMRMWAIRFQEDPAIAAEDTAAEDIPAALALAACSSSWAAEAEASSAPSS